MSEPANTSEARVDPEGRGLPRFRYEYGAEPLHLIAVLASLGLAGYAVLRIFDNPFTGRVLIWLAAAALLHDLVALPLYSALNKIAEGAAELAIQPRVRMLIAYNHVRIPAGLSLLLLLAWFPLILRIDPENYEATTGIPPADYLERWLLISAAMFLISGISLALRLRRGPTPVPPDTGRGSVPRLKDRWRVTSGLVLGVFALMAVWVAAVAVVGLLDSGI
jgi:hypothetical protein